MSLLADIKVKQIAARIQKDAAQANILTTLLGEAAMVGKNDGNRESTDEEVTKVIAKFVKNIDETLKVVGKDDPRAFDLKFEKDLLSKFLPKQMTDDEVESIILDAFPDKSSVGQVMGYLRENYANQYDAKATTLLLRDLWD